ncbi:hypothetical protein HMPREF1870_02859 [Bacteroidales bacterium KA00344]|nr:hypothetical protein HMPREF1870_02859 [Bacteroidales bacterium KA00344]
MNKYMIYSLMLAMAFFTTGCSDDDDTTTGKGEVAIEVIQPPKTNKMNVYIHYMPWFETPETNGGKWDSHWTMNTCDPKPPLSPQRNTATDISRPCKSSPA